MAVLPSCSFPLTQSLSSTHTTRGPFLPFQGGPAPALISISKITKIFQRFNVPLAPTDPSNSYQQDCRSEPNGCPTSNRFKTIVKSLLLVYFLTKVPEVSEKPFVSPLNLVFSNRGSGRVVEVSLIAVLSVQGKEGTAKIAELVFLGWLYFSDGLMGTSLPSHRSHPDTDYKE